MHAVQHVSVVCLLVGAVLGRDATFFEGTHKRESMRARPACLSACRQVMGPFSFSHTELKMRDSASPEMKGGMGAALLGVKVICPCLFTVQDKMSRYLVIPVHPRFPTTRFFPCFGLVGIVVCICGNYLPLSHTFRRRLQRKLCFKPFQ